MSTTPRSPQGGPAGDHSSPRSDRMAVDTDDRPSSSRDTSRPATSRSGYTQWATDKQLPQSSTASLADELDYDSSEETDGDGDSDLDEGGQISPSGPGAALGEGVSRQDFVYVLEVVQQPQRARACGFGDKDRRPLSPPPIIQLRIFDKAGKSIAPHHVDIHRLILMVDLWNGDQTQQRSIVMHLGARPDPQSAYTQPSRPSSQPHRYDAPPQSTFSRTPLRSTTSGAFAWPGREWDGYTRGGVSVPSPPPHGGQYSHSPGRGSVMGWPPPSEAQLGVDYGPRSEWHEDPRASSSTRPTLAHTDSHSAVRSLSSDSRVWTPESTAEYPHERYPPEGGWNKDTPYASGRDWAQGPGYSDWDRLYPPSSSSRPWSSGDIQRRRSQTGGRLFTHAPSPISQQAPLPLTSSPPSLYQDAYSERVSITSHYSRVLVGSLGAVCQRLKGLDGKTGLFFFTHDLGIRTEGTFSLRFTLVDLSFLMTNVVVKDESAPTLARVSSDTFTVYSAKRFPGVLPTTELTQCFADQSVRLPTRQKRGHTGGTSGSKRKK